MLQFLKMNAVGNDFIIFDARASEIKHSSLHIQKLCNRQNIGCDQLLVIRNSARAECFMEIYNQDGSQSAVCGNATRCVASLIMEEKNSSAIVIETAAGLLNCWRNDNNNISVEIIARKALRRASRRGAWFYLKIVYPHNATFTIVPQ